MEWYIYLIVIWIVACGLCSLIAAITARGKVARAIIVATAVVAILLTFAAPFQMLGRPKPVKWAWLERGIDEAEIVGVDLQEGRGIFMMLKYDGDVWLYEFPWNQQFAENIQEAMQQAQEQGTRAMVERPFEGASPMAPLEDLINDLLGNGQGEGGEGSASAESGEGEGEGDGQGQDGNQLGGGNQSFEDRNPPRVYPAPVPPRRPKPPEDPGIIYERPGDGE